MKLYFIFFLMAVVTNPLFGQQMTLLSDAQFDGLKGKVKSVKSERTSYDQNGNVSYKRGEYSSVTSYDKVGNEIEVVSYENKTSTYKTTYWRKNGELFYKGQSLIVREQSAQIPENEKILPRDTSFDSKVLIKYDVTGNLIEKRIYGNNGIFNNRRIYEYDKKRNKLKEVVFTGDGELYNDSTKYTYDSKGMVIEETSFVTGPLREESTAHPNNKLSYEYVNFDEKGNWLERKEFENMKRGVESAPKLVRTSYQTITYY
jgi:hypothetical protein